MSILFTMIALMGCMKQPSNSEPVIPKASNNLHIRRVFDVDPSDYIGRFVEDGSTSFDETTARKTECSKYISYRKVGGGNVEYDEVMNASGTVAGGLKIPGAGGVRVGAETTIGVRTSYVMANKMMADIKEPGKFDACCAKKPGNCTERFIAEFIEGNGSLWIAHSKFKGMSFLNKLKEKLPVKMEASGNYNWAQSRQFPNPVYFAYKVGKVPKISCKALIDNPPDVTNGMYFGAISDRMKSEQLARKNAFRNAKLKVIQFIAEKVVSNRTTKKSFITKAQALLEDEERMSNIAEGVATGVKEDRYCPIEKTNLSDGVVYVSRMLVFVTNNQLLKMQQEILGN